MLGRRCDEGQRFFPFPFAGKGRRWILIPNWCQPQPRCIAKAIRRMSKDMRCRRVCSTAMAVSRNHQERSGSPESDGFLSDWYRLMAAWLRCDDLQETTTTTTTRCRLHMNDKTRRNLVKAGRSRRKISTADWLGGYYRIMKKLRKLAKFLSFNRIILIWISFIVSYSSFDDLNCILFAYFRLIELLKFLFD